MQALCVAYTDDGLHIVLNSKNTTNTWASGHFSSNGYTWLHNYQGDINNAVWYNCGYPGSIPYKLVIDRDGYIRFADHWLSAAEATILECLGVAE